MTMIRVDPGELDGSSEVLRSCAVRLNEIGSTLAGCIVPPIPSDLEGATMTLVRTVDHALQRVAGELDRTASDLRRRAAVAATDLAAAASVATPGSVGAAGNGSVVMITVGSTNLPSIPGANQVVPITVRSPGLTSILGAQAVIPITVRPTGLGSLPGSSGTTSITVGPTGLTSLPGSGAVPPTSERSTRLTEAEANRMLEASILGVTPGAMLADTVDKRNRFIAKLLAPTKLQMENKFGYQLTVPDYYRHVPEAHWVYNPWV